MLDADKQLIVDSHNTYRSGVSPTAAMMYKMVGSSSFTETYYTYSLSKIFPTLKNKKQAKNNLNSLQYHFQVKIKKTQQLTIITGE